MGKKNTVVKRLLVCARENMGHRKKKRMFMFLNGLLYDIWIYEKYIRNMSEEERHNDGDERLEKDQKQSKVKQDCDKSCVTNRDNNITLDSENYAAKGNMSEYFMSVRYKLSMGS